MFFNEYTISKTENNLNSQMIVNDVETVEVALEDSFELVKAVENN